MPPRIFDLYRARYDGQYSFDFLQDRIAEFDREHGSHTREVRISYEPGDNPRLSFETLGDAQALGEFLEPIIPVGVILEVIGIEAYEPDDLVYGSRNEIVGVHSGHRRSGSTRYVRGGERPKKTFPWPKFPEKPEPHLPTRAQVVFDLWDD